MTTFAAEEEKRQAVERETKKTQMIEEVREHLSFVTANLATIPEIHMPEEEKEELRVIIGKIRYFLTKGCWEKGEFDPQTPVSYIQQMICRKNGGVAELCGSISGPRLKGWTRMQRQQKDMLRACLVRACHYVRPDEYHPEWMLPWTDPRNTHPGAVSKREQKGLEKERATLDKNAERLAKQRKIERLEKESEERLKTREKQRKERAKHFKEQEKKRSGNKA